MSKNISIDTNQMREDEERLMEFLDLEEELGCPFNILFKALKNGVYIENDIYGEDAKNGLKYFDTIYVKYSEGEIRIGVIHHSMWKGDEIIDTRKLSDYEKTWWLKEDKSE